MGNTLLFLAIVFEVIGTTAMKMSEGFTKLLPSIVMALTYALSFGLFTIALKYNIEVGKAYAIWSGLGTAMITIIGIMIFNESLNFIKISGIVLIIAGVIILNLFDVQHQL